MNISVASIPIAKLDTNLFSWEPRQRSAEGNKLVGAYYQNAIRKVLCNCHSTVAYFFATMPKAICIMASIAFDILIDDTLAKITKVSQLQNLINKRVLSLVNDFEDGKWRYNRFQSYLWDNIAQTALSEKERAALADQSHSSLVASARNLRLTDNDEIGQGSEIAEVFLYGLMKNHYNALSVVPKIFYKQNTQDNAKGADSVHIVINEDASDFTLWFGEAKFYNSIVDARLDAVVKSVYTSLDTGKLKKENSIITNVSDLDQLNIPDSLRQNIKDALSSQNSIDHLKPKIHIPILILHECSDTAACYSLSDEYKSSMVAYHTTRAEAYFQKQIAKSSTLHNYNDIKFHLILFPVPNKSLIVNAFCNTASQYKAVS